MRPRPGQEGLGLLEAVVGFAVGSVLLLAMLQLLTDLIRLENGFRNETRHAHRERVLHRILAGDLAFRSGEGLDLVGTPDRLLCTVPSLSNPRLLRILTRVRYRVETRTGTPSLVRDRRWIDLQDRFGGEDVLLQSEWIRFEYRARGGPWRARTRSLGGPPTMVRLRWAGGSLAVRPVRGAGEFP